MLFGASYFCPLALELDFARAAGDACPALFFAPRPSPCFAAFSASRIAPQCLHTATPCFTFSPHAGQSFIRIGPYAHSRPPPRPIAARRCKSEISRNECPRAHIV